MKALKYIGITLAAILILILALALFIPGQVQYEKSITINAPIDSVWLHVNSLSAMDKWSPWNDHDPNMKKSLPEKDGVVGAVFSWESEIDEVGKGSQTISKIEAPTLIEADLKFLVPYESEAKGIVKLSPEGQGTKVTWGFESEIPYPFRIMKLWINMDEMLDKDWNNGLGKLKALCEK